MSFDKNEFKAGLSGGAKIALGVALIPTSLVVASLCLAPFLSVVAASGIAVLGVVGMVGGGALVCNGVDQKGSLLAKTLGFVAIGWLAGIGTAKTVHTVVDKFRELEQKEKTSLIIKSSALGKRTAAFYSDFAKAKSKPTIALTTAAAKCDVTAQKMS